MAMNELESRLEGVRRVHRFWDANVGLLRRKTAEMGRPITCGGIGCSACCSEPVLSTRQEAELVLIGMSAEEQTRLRVAMLAWLGKAWGTGQLKRETPDAFAYRAAKLPCPLLDAAGGCSVYEKRPIACRAHVAIGPVKKCFNDMARREQEYCTSPELLMRAVVEEAEPEAKSLLLVSDLLHVWLCELLLPEAELPWDVKTGPKTRHSVEIQFT